MSDFIFARKPSNLILLCPAKARKPHKHQQTILNQLAVKGTIAEKPIICARGRVQIYGFASFSLSLGARNLRLSVLLARLRAKFDYSGGHKWHQPTCQEGFVVDIT